MRPTNAQILEGRDEALEHLGISLVDWEVSTPAERRHLVREATHTSTDIAAAETVIDATIHGATLKDAVDWFFFRIGVILRKPPAQTDYALQA